MKPDEKNKWNQLSAFMKKWAVRERKRIIDFVLPPDGIMFLFQKEQELKIKLVVEKTDSHEDYVIAEVPDNENWIYLFQQLTDKLRKRFGKNRFYSSSEIDDRAIAKVYEFLKSRTV